MRRAAAAILAAAVALAADAASARDPRRGDRPAQAEEDVARAFAAAKAKGALVLVDVWAPW